MEFNGIKVGLINESMNLADRKNEMCQSHMVAEHKSQDVMSRYFGITYNQGRPLIMEKINLNRIITKHGDNGVINISACRSNLPPAVNDERTKSLLDDIRQSGFTYMPTYGGYRNTDVGEEADYEPSFIVFNYDRQGQPISWEALRNFGLEMCRKYNQDSVLLKAPGQDPIYADANGNRVNDRQTDKVFKNDPEQPFFTSLKSKEDVDKEIDAKLMSLYHKWQRETGKTLNKQELEKFKRDHLKDVQNIGRRYTYDIQFDECVLVNPAPCTLTEQMMRMARGEIMPWDI